MKTTLVRKQDREPTWYVIDAENEILGRLAVRVANILRGRHLPSFTPHEDAGDCVIIINAEKVRLTGRKEEQKEYMFYSGYFGNERYRGVPHFRSKKPAFIIEHAVKGMLPKNRLSNQLIKKLKVYAGSEHPHEAQNPQPLPEHLS